MCTWDPRVGHTAKRIIKRTLAKHPQKRPDIHQLDALMQSRVEHLGEKENEEEEDEEEEEGQWGLGHVYTASLKDSDLTTEVTGADGNIREGWKLPVMPEAITDIWGSSSSSSNNNNKSNNNNNSNSNSNSNNSNNKSNIDKSTSSSVVSGASSPREGETSPLSALPSSETTVISRNGQSLLSVQGVQVNPHV